MALSLFTNDLQSFLPGVRFFDFNMRGLQNGIVHAIVAPIRGDRRRFNRSHSALHRR